MNTTSEITLDLQDQLEGLWKPLRQTYQLQFAEYSFTNTFLFRREHSFRIIEHPTLCIQGQFLDGGTFLIPTTPPQLAQPSLQNPSRHHCIFPIPDQWVDFYREQGRQLSFSRADSDYLFHKEKLSSLKGRGLSSRRNLLHQLTQQHQLIAKPLTSAEIPDALKILEVWQAADKLPKEKTDYFACIDALTYLERLDLFGRILYAENQPIGFILGNLLNSQTAILHFAKALKDIKGITPFLYQDFAKHLSDEVKWINLEQDLGIPALRQAKTAYEPDRLLTKWRICG